MSERKSQRAHKRDENDHKIPSSSNIKFITFGGPTVNYHKRVNEICKQALLIESLFSEVKGFTDLDLKADTSFWQKHGQFIESNPRGYGYWLWKPYLIKKTIETMNDDEILIYADSGCYLNLNALSVKRLFEYVQIVKESPTGILAFQMEHLPEYKYTKRETAETILKTENLTTVMSSGQCMATVVILRKTVHSLAFVNEWFNYSEIYDLINDSKSRPEHVGFIDHRHDQSIYSLLLKTRGAYLIRDETYFHPNWKQTGANFPIWAVRNRG